MLSSLNTSLLSALRGTWRHFFHSASQIRHTQTGTLCTKFGPRTPPPFVTCKRLLSPPAMATSSKALSFFDLPREIRDEIYRHYFSGVYFVPEQCDIGDAFTLLQGPPISICAPKERNILKVNEAVREEAEASLYRHASFRIFPNAQRLSQAVANRMLEIRFSPNSQPPSQYDAWLASPAIRRQSDRA